MTNSTDRRHAAPASRHHLPTTETVGSIRALPTGLPRASTQLVRRPRLLALLNATPAPALTIVQAGSGFGKTTLLADWLRTRPDATPSVWVTVDESIHDAVTFWQETLAGLGRVGLVGGTALSEVEVRSDIIDTIVAPLQRGFTSLPHPVTVVIDGFERLAGTDVEHALLDLLRCTDNLRLVIATHVASEIGAVTTAAQIDTLLLDASALRFDAHEVARLASHLRIDASPRDLERLHRDLDGWPFGVRAVLERRRRSESSTLADAQSATFLPVQSTLEPLDADFAHRYLLASLEPIAGLDSLTAVSVLDAFTSEQAALLGADPDTHPLLATLESRGLGTWDLDTTAPEYRLHPVLRRALRKRLERDPAAVRTAYSRLAQWHLTRADHARAFEAAIHASQWELASRCVRSGLFEILSRLRAHPDLLAAVPQRILNNEPLLMLVSGIALYGRGNQGKAVRALLTAVAACETQRLVSRGEPTPDQVWVQGILAVTLRLVGRYELVPAALRRFQRMLETVDDPADHLEPAMLIFRTQSIVTHSFLDDVDAAEHLAVETMHSGHPMTALQRAHLHGLAALTHARRGDVTRAASVLEDMEGFGLPRQFDDSFYAVTAHIAAATVAIEQFAPDAAAERLSRADRHWPTMEYWPLIVEMRTRIAWQKHGPLAALSTLREGRAEKRHKVAIGHAMTALLMALEAELLLAAGQGGHAVALMTPTRVRRSLRLVVPKSRSLLLAGKWEQAASLAGRHLLDPSQPWQNRTDLLLISASANLHSDHSDAAERQFTEASRIAERTGHLTPFAAMPRADLLVLGAEHQALLDRLPAKPSRYPAPGARLALTRREQLVLAELASDRTLPEIATDLSVSVNTLKSQLRSIYKKLEVPGRDAAVRSAHRRGLLLPSTTHLAQEDR